MTKYPSLISFIRSTFQEPTSIGITCRPESLLKNDFTKYNSELQKRINGKKVLVIGGAGTIGSFYIKTILKSHISWTHEKQ